MPKEIVVRGKYTLSLDLERTKEYYQGLNPEIDREYKNFIKYCERLAADERAFFDSLGIDLFKCSEIYTPGATKKGYISYYGHYLICADLIDEPIRHGLVLAPDGAIESYNVEAFVNNEIYVGNFELQFTEVFDEDGRCKYQDAPDGFISLDFNCRIKWLLDEEIERYCYEPPRFYELRRKMHEYRYKRKFYKLMQSNAHDSYERLFDELGISYERMKKSEILKHKKEWLVQFAPPGIDMKDAYDSCVENKRGRVFLWALFAFNLQESIQGQPAIDNFNLQNESEYVIIDNTAIIGYRISSAENITAEALASNEDITVTAADFSFTYSHTHEDDCGPYFYKK